MHVRRRQLLLPAILLLVAGLSVSACDAVGGEDEPDLEGGTFSLTASGDVEEEVSGKAYFAVADSAQAGDARGAFYLFFLDTSGEDSAAIALARPGMDIPEEDTYDIGSFREASNNPESFDSFVATYQSQQSETFLGSTDGELDISSASSSTLTGTFSFSAEELVLFGDTTRAEADIDGQFSAERRDYDELEDVLGASAQVAAEKRAALPLLPARK